MESNLADRIKKKDSGSTMIRITCPRCGEINYTETIESCVSCGECKTDYSGFPGRVCRKEPRKSATIPFRMQFNGQDFKGQVLNLSKGGVGVKIFNGYPVKERDVLELIAKDGIIFAENVWCRQYPDFSLMGLKRLGKDIGLKEQKPLN